MKILSGKNLTGEFFFTYSQRLHAAAKVKSMVTVTIDYRYGSAALFAGSATWIDP